MKRLILFFALTLVIASAAFARTVEVPTGTDYDGMIATFAGFAGCVVLLTEGIKALFPKMEGLATQAVSWAAGLAAAMLLWWLDAGFVAGVEWYTALLYGFGASLVANGIADTGLVQWLIGLITKRTESKS